MTPKILTYSKFSKYHAVIVYIVICNKLIIKWQTTKARLAFNLDKCGS